MQPQMCSCI